MPHIYIDDKLIQAKDTDTIIQAAFNAGINIPHFCWHPELSVAGNCRMCLVEIGMPKKNADGSIALTDSDEQEVAYFPKLQIACATQVAEGMRVRLHSAKTLKTQEAVMEFLLINHPLDCPICDEAGQCKLQEYAFRNSSGESRFEENKNPKPKRVHWGANIMFDAERCISCSRCIRFTKEIGKEDVLSFVGRGDKNVIEVANGQSLTNAYSMNIIDICPVGALTSQDFRFKSRVWDMSFNDSICNGCSRGCNIKLGVRNNEVLRVEAKSNPFVNKEWICDSGRLNSYKDINRNRIIEPTIKNGAINETATWDLAIDAATQLIKKTPAKHIYVIGSPFATIEDNYALEKFAQLSKINKIGYLEYIDKNFGDDFLKNSDLTPNSAGLNEIGFAKKSISAESLSQLIKSGDIQTLILLDEKLGENEEFLRSIDKLNTLIIFASNHNPLTKKANVVFPIPSFAELEGVWVNSSKRAQVLSPAIVTRENERTMGMKMSRLDKFGSQNDRWTNGEIRNCRQAWKILQSIAAKFGEKWNFKKSEDVFSELTAHYPAFKAMNYAKLEEHLGIQLHKGETPDAIPFIYESHFMKP